MFAMRIGPSNLQGNIGSDYGCNNRDNHGCTLGVSPDDRNKVIRQGKRLLRREPVKDPDEGDYRKRTRSNAKRTPNTRIVQRLWKPPRILTSLRGRPLLWVCGGGCGVGKEGDCRGFSRHHTSVQLLPQSRQTLDIPRRKRP